MTKTILMIHGFGATGESWTAAAAKFRAAGYAVETPTIHAAHRTVGPPPASLAGKTLADYVAEMSDLARSIATRDGEKPVVFGHSMGGLISQKLAEADLVAGAVLFAPASPADARGKTSLSSVFTFLNIALASKPETKAVKIWKTGFNWGVLNKTPPERREAIFATTVHESGRVLSDMAYPERDPNKTVTIDAAKVTAPLLILAGARDRTTPIEDVRLVAKKYAGSTFKSYPDNGHWLIDEPGSAEILNEVAVWLDTKGLGVKALLATAPEAETAAEPASAPVAKPPVAKAKTAPKTAAAKPKAAPVPPPAPTAKAAPAPKAPPPKAPQPAAKVAATPKAPAKAAAPKAAPVSKIAKAVPEKAPAKAPAKTPKAGAKPAAEAAVGTPAKAKAAPAAKTVKAAPKSKPKSEAQAAVKPAAAPKIAKPAPAKVASTRTAAKAAPKPAPKPTKPAATKSTAKSSPSGKKSV
jgi:alpha-beta hydrolase superfamily lysophospholipase